MITHKLNVYEFPKFYWTQPSLKLKTQDSRMKLRIEKQSHTFVRDPCHPSLVLSLMSFLTSSFFILDEDPAMS